MLAVFIAGILTGVFLAGLLIRFWHLILYWYALGAERRARKQDIKDGIKQLEEHINQEED